MESQKCEHHFLCQCEGKVTPPEVTETKVYIDGAMYYQVGIGFSRHSDGKNKWYVYYLPKYQNRYTNRINRMPVHSWRKAARNPS